MIKSSLLFSLVLYNILYFKPKEELNMAVQVLMAEAYCDENKKAGYEGCKPGDQLQKVKAGSDDYVGEVRISKYRDFATIVIRYKDKRRRFVHAAASRFFANSPLVGYSQPDRMSLDTEVRRVGLDNYEDIKNKCNCDCSSMQALCARIAGVAEFKNWCTADMVSGFTKLYKYQRGEIAKKEVPSDFLALDKYFSILMELKYTQNSDFLLEGDMLLKNGHIANSLTDGASSTKYSTLEKQAGSDKSRKGTYITNCPLNLRYGSSTDYEIIKILKTGDKLKSSYGRYGANPKWLKVKEVSTGIIGYVNSDYITKLESTK